MVDEQVFDQKFNLNSSSPQDPQNFIEATIIEARNADVDQTRSRLQNFALALTRRPNASKSFKAERADKKGAEPSQDFTDCWINHRAKRDFK